MNETKQNLSYNFELLDVEADVILEALGALPFAKVNPIVTKMFAQAQEQAKARAEVAAADAAGAASLEKAKELLVEKND